MPARGEIPNIELIDDTLVEQPTSEGPSPARVAEALAKDETEMDAFNLKVLLNIIEIRDKMEQVFASGDDPFEAKTPPEIAFRKSMRAVEEATNLNTVLDGGPVGVQKIKGTVLPHFRVEQLADAHDIRQRLQKRTWAKDQADTFESLAELCGGVVTASEDMLISNGDASLSERFNPALGTDTLLGYAEDMHARIKELADAQVVYEALADLQLSLATVEGLEHFKQGPRVMTTEDRDRIYTYNSGSGNDPIGAR